MQAYGRIFAHVYDAKWGAFVREVAPFLLDFYAATPMSRNHKPVLDLCCGTGHLALYFLERGYRVVGIDLSEHMLHLAELKARKYVESGQARLVLADASDFALDESFGLVVSTYDSLNHLESEQSLRRCFQCIRAVCRGFFIFDLNTRSGLRAWNSIHVDESSEHALIVNRGVYDGHGDKAWMRISGFFRMDGGQFERFEETVYNTVFEMEAVRQALLDTGWSDVRFARIRDLTTPLAEPEKERRVFVVAT
ncbi:MAG: class I SAM-dependent DNA methyltransferase [Dehalococcoidia bacterium]